MGSALMGGSSSSSQQGYSALSPTLKKEFDPFGAAINYFTLPQFGAANTAIPGLPATGANRGGGNNGGNHGNRGGAPTTPMGPATGGNMGVIDRFTPLAETDAERNAISNINRGFTPTADSLRADIGMQMDPYMDSVIGGMNRSADGNWSMLKEGLQGAGQGSGAFGSNRSILGANDIDMARQNNIGSFLSGEFNTSLNNAMNVLPGQRTADAQNQLQGGSFLRGLDMQTKQAPITALQTGTQMMSPFISGGTSQSQTTNGFLPMLMNAAAMGAKASDRRLKENIKPLGTENGHNIYEFSYRGAPHKYIGVMADEVQKTHPEAVKEFGGYLAVNYAAIGVEFREAG